MDSRWGSVLRTGYIVVFNSKTPFGRIIVAVTKVFSEKLGKVARATHVALLERDGKGQLWIIHMKYGYFFRKPSIVREKYNPWKSKGTAYIVRLKPGLFVDEYAAAQVVLKRAKRILSKGARYDWFEIYGFKSRLLPRRLRAWIDRHRPPLDSPDRYICSSFIAKAWAPQGGVLRAMLDSMPSRETLILEDPRGNYQRVAPVDFLTSPFTEVVCEKSGTAIAWHKSFHNTAKELI